MNNIASEIAALPPNLQAEVLDFVQFIKQRHGLAVAPAEVAMAADAGDSPFFRAMESAGLVGCIKTDEQLSTTYKNKPN